MIGLLVDSASDILQNNAENIYVVPLSINILGNDYLDGVEINNDDFYAKLTSGKVYSKTAAPSPDAYIKIFEEVKANGDELICLLLSSGVSGTYQSACIAKDVVGYDKIHVVDTLTGSYGVKLLTIEAQRMIAQGATCEQIIEKVLELKNRVKVFLSVDTLDYLIMGGRVSKLAGTVGSLLKLKPILIMTDGKGYIESLDKKRGTIKATERMIEIMNENGGMDLNEPIFIGYTGEPTLLDKFENTLKEEFKFEKAERGIVGPVIGSHLGPGAKLITYVKNK